MNNTTLLILFFALSLPFISANCTTKKYVPKNNDNLECNTYFKFIKNNWIPTESGYFSFKDIELIYQEYDKKNYDFPFNNCLIKGRNKSFIRELLGVPNTEIVIRTKDDMNHFVYCMDESCINSTNFLGMSGMGIIIYFNPDDTVKDIYAGVGYLELYRTLNRQ